jgi:hypothetical protein
LCDSFSTVLKMRFLLGFSLVFLSRSEDFECSVIRCSVSHFRVSHVDARAVYLSGFIGQGVLRRVVFWHQGHLLLLHLSLWRTTTQVRFISPPSRVVFFFLIYITMYFFFLFSISFFYRIFLIPLYIS